MPLTKEQKLDWNARIAKSRKATVKIVTLTNRPTARKRRVYVTERIGMGEGIGAWSTALGTGQEYHRIAGRLIKKQHTQAVIWSSENTMFYILDSDKQVVKVDIDTWAEWRERANRNVARTFVKGKIVSTIFLGYNAGGLPSEQTYFETMVFDKPEDGSGKQIGKEDTRDGFFDRYETYEQALNGHWRTVELVERSE